MPRNYAPRPWPYIAKAARDNAAEEIAAALKSTIVLMPGQSDPETLRSFTLIVYHLQNALRHLEAAGAPTRPAT